MAKLLQTIRAAVGQNTVRILLSLVLGLIAGGALAGAPFLDRVLAVADPVGGL